MKMENTNLNIPSVTVDELVDLLTDTYSECDFDGVLTPFLWGPAGVGKSQAVMQFAKRLQKITKKTVTVTDVRLLLFSPIDLRGVPVADADKKFTQWLMPKIFAMNPDDSHINILFLDELSAAPQSVQSAAYQITLDKKIGEHRLPENCIVIAAGNRTTDGSVSYKMPKALCNRLMHFNVTTTYDAWLRWAVEQGIDNRIIGYLAFDNSKLCVEPESSDMAYPTPRSWSYVSNIIKNSDDISKKHTLIGACIGVDSAIEFETWVKNRGQMPDVSDVFKGKRPKYPPTHDSLMAFTASLVFAVRNNKDITLQELENVCAYVGRFPADFAMTFYTDLNAIEDIRLKLMKCPSSALWFAKNKKYF